MPTSSWDALRKNILPCSKADGAIEHQRIAAEKLTSILEQLRKKAVVGVTLKALEREAQFLLSKENLKSLNQGYKPRWAQTAYPSVICLSPNNVAVHGIPNTYTLKNGDLLKIDMGVTYNGMCADKAVTVAIGDKVKPRDYYLMTITKRCLKNAIAMIRPGLKTRDVGRAIGLIAQDAKLLPLVQYGGHAIGKEMHESPYVPNFDDVNATGVFEEGKVYCIEPILSNGSNSVYMADEWTAKVEKGNVAQFEDMVLVTHDGCEILSPLTL